MGEVGSIASLSQESTHAPFIGIGRGSGAARLHAFTPPSRPRMGMASPPSPGAYKSAPHRLFDYGDWFEPPLARLRTVPKGRRAGT
jgi:hypothetical protein